MVFACYRLQKKFLYALVDLEVLLVKSGANTLCRHISCRVIDVAEILLWCRKVMCTTVSYFLPRGSSSFSYTDLFLLFRKKTGGARPPRPLPLLRHCFVSSFCLLLHRLDCRKDQFAVLYFSTSLVVLIQVYNWEIRHHSLVCCCGFADILNILMLFYFAMYF